MKRFALLLVIIGVCFAGEKIVLDQSVIIRYVPSHWDTVWTDGVKTAVYIAAKKDTTLPTMATHVEYKVTDSTLGVDSTWNYFVYMVRKKGAQIKELDTFKVKTLQPNSTIRTKVLIMN